MLANYTDIKDLVLNKVRLAYCKIVSKVSIVERALDLVYVPITYPILLLLSGGIPFLVVFSPGPSVETLAGVVDPEACTASS